MVKIAILTADGLYRFVTAKNGAELAKEIRMLVRSGVRSVNFMGIGNRKEFHGLELIRKPGNLIQAELTLQAKGVRRLLALSRTKVDNFFLASIGTGTSYVIVRQDQIEVLLFGRPLGGATIMGLGKALGLGQTFEEIANTAWGKPLDIFVRDLVPEPEIDPYDMNTIIANFGRARKKSSRVRLASSIFHLVACNIAQDVAMLGSGISDPRYVIYIGTPVANSTKLRHFLQEYSKIFGFYSLILPNAAYAGALGALHMNDKE